jgi:hypothetical protein
MIDTGCEPNFAYVMDKLSGVKNKFKTNLSISLECEMIYTIKSFLGIDSDYKGWANENNWHKSRLKSRKLNAFSYYPPTEDTIIYEVTCNNKPKLNQSLVNNIMSIVNDEIEQRVSFVYEPPRVSEWIKQNGAFQVVYYHSIGYVEISIDISKIIPFKHGLPPKEAKIYDLISPIETEVKTMLHLKSNYSSKTTIESRVKEYLSDSPESLDVYGDY